MHHRHSHSATSHHRGQQPCVKNISVQRMSLLLWMTTLVTAFFFIFSTSMMGPLLPHSMSNLQRHHRRFSSFFSSGCFFSSSFLFQGAEAAITFTNGTSAPIIVLPDYTAEYVVHCESPAIFWSGARAACAAKGDGWALATVPSQVAQDTIASLNPSRIFLAGSDAAVQNRWVWVEGRLGKGLYEGLVNWTGSVCLIPPCAAPAGQYQNFPPYQPDNSQNYTANVEMGLEMFDISRPDRMWNDVPDTFARNCYACERSLCTLALDCNTTNTVAINTSKYIAAGTAGGHCGCVCKDGFSGPRCDGIAPVVSVIGQYLSQFMGACASQPLSWTDAADRCSARGNGWALATINSATVQTTVATLTPGLGTWIGGNDLTVSNNFVWQFGRQKGQTVYAGRKTGGICTIGPCASPPGMYSNFAFDQPDDAAGLESYMVMFGGPKTWNDGPLFYATTSCYACERSRCTLALDCNPSNTLALDTNSYSVLSGSGGPGGHCGCVCKDGFTGPRCEDAVVSVLVVLPPSSFSPAGGATYTSEYRADCSAQPLTWSTARFACLARGSGWDIASVPTANAQGALGNITRDRTWLGGSDNASEGIWAWRGGRLTGHAFFRGTRNGSLCTAGPCACEPGAFCNFFPNEPNNGLGTVQENFLWVAATSPNQWSDAPDDTAAVTYCVACERSFCSLSADCNATNTIWVNTSKYFVFGEPCGCVCKDGFSGPRCDGIAPVISVNGQYLSQFMAECSSQIIRWDDAAGACHAKGLGWALATIDSAAAQTTVAGLHDDYLWLGASDATAEALWQWQFGRLKNKTFYRGARNASAVCVTPPCACEVGAFCHWSPQEPNNYVGGSEDFLEMRSAGSSPTRIWNDSPSPYIRTRCYACERSFCAKITALPALQEALRTRTLAVSANASISGPLPGPLFALFPNCSTMSATIGNPSVTATRNSTSTSISLSVTGQTETPPQSPSATTTMTMYPSVTKTTPIFDASTAAPTTTTTTTAATTSVASSVTTTTAIQETTTPAASTAESTAESATAPTTNTSAPAITPPPTTTTTTTTVCDSAAFAVPVTSAVILRVVAGVSQATTATFLLSTATTANLAPFVGPSGAAALISVPTWAAATEPQIASSSSSAPIPSSAASTDPTNATYRDALLTVAFLTLAAPLTACRVQLQPSSTSPSGGQTTISCALPAFVIPVTSNGPTATYAHVTANIPLGTAAAAAATAAGPSTSSASSLSAAVCNMPLALTLVLDAATSNNDPDGGAFAAVVTVVLSSGAVATSAFAVLAEPWAVEPLVLVGVLSGPCSPSAVQDTARIALYALNPFAALKPPSAGLLLILVAFVVAVVNAIVAFVRTSQAAHYHAPLSSSSSSPPMVQRAVQRMVGRALFPRLGFAVAVAVLPGVAWAAAKTIQQQYGHRSASSSTDPLNLLSLILCAVFVSFVPCVGALVIVRWIPAEYTRRRPSPYDTCWQRLTWPSGQWTPLSTTVSGRSADPIPHALNVRGMTAAGAGGVGGLMELLPLVGSALLPAAIFALTVAPPASTGCAARQYIAASIFAASAVAVAALRPHRTLLTTVLTVLVLLCAAAVTTVIGAFAPAVHFEDSNRRNSPQHIQAQVAAALASVAVVLSVLRSLHAVFVVARTDAKLRAHAAAGSEEDCENTHELALHVATTTL